MQLTLRQAHKLIEKIGTRLSTVRLTASGSISIYTQEDVGVVVNRERAKFQAELRRQLDLLQARQELRMSIQAANVSEVNNLVAIRKALLDELGTYRHLQNLFPSKENTSIEELQAELATMKATPSTYQHSVSFSMLDANAIDDLDRNINQLQLRVEGIEEQLSIANTSGVVGLSAQSEQLLRREGVIQ